MAKNTSTSAFRKIDVDQYNEDNYKDEDQSESQTPTAGPDENEVMSLLTQSKNIEALKLVLRLAPVGTKNQLIKDNALQLVLKVLLSIKTIEMQKAVSTLDREHIDTLMKYIYKGFEYPSEGSSCHLLAWYEKVYAIGGIGSVVRVLTDRKRV
ncbi:ARPC5 (predicted) [Pycnogonum litorale]